MGILGEDSGLGGSGLGLGGKGAGFDLPDSCRELPFSRGENLLGLGFGIWGLRVCPSIVVVLINKCLGTLKHLNFQPGHT